MTSAKNHAPKNFRSITPHLICKDALDAIEFYKKAFNAVEMSRLMGPDGSLMHGCLQIGDSVIMLADEAPDYGAFGPQPGVYSPVSIHLYVEDVDAAMAQAEQAGAKVVMPAEDMFWGDRYGQIQDPFGHRWSLATFIREVPPEELQSAMMQQFGDQ